MEQRQEIKRDSKFYNEYPNCRIRDQIERLHITYKEAASVLRDAGISGTSAEAVRQWCGGYTRPDMGKLVDIASALKCSVSYLFGIDDYPDMNVSDIGRKTRLTEAAITAIQEYPEEEMALLNALLSDSRFCGSFLFFVVEALHAKLVECEIPKHKDHAYNVAFPSAEMPGYYTVFGGIASELFIETAMHHLQTITLEKVKDAVNFMNKEVPADGND